MGIRTRMLTTAFAAAVVAAPGATGLPSAGADSNARAASISVRVSEAVVLVGQRVVVKGRVRPAKPGTRVMLQQRVTRGWKNIAKREAGPTGRYRFRVVPGRGGVFRYRVVKLPWRPGGARSETIRLTVYEWHRIDGLVVDTDNANFGTDSEIAGATYPNSVELDADTGSEDPPDEPGFFDVDARGKCAVLDTTVGALDDNTAGTEVDVRVSGDGVALATGTYAVGESDRLTVDIRGVSLLRVTTLTVEQGVDRALGVGTPRVLCTF